MSIPCRLRQAPSSTDPLDLHSKDHLARHIKPRLDPRNTVHQDLHIRDIESDAHPLRMGQRIENSQAGVALQCR